MSTETLRPNATGDEENIRYWKLDTEAGHYHWEAVDEVTPDEGATYVNDSDKTTYYRDLYNVPDHSGGSGTINHITVHCRCYPSAAPNQASVKVAIKSGTGTGAPDTVDESTEKTLTETTWTDESKQWATNPATSSAWTWDEIDKLQIGLALRSFTSASAWSSYCTQVYVEVDYTAVTFIPTVTII